MPEENFSLVRILFKFQLGRNFALGLGVINRNVKTRVRISELSVKVCFFIHILTVYSGS